MLSTNDSTIRAELRKFLEADLERYKSDSGHPAEIFEELGVSHGRARIDMAVVNGIMHGYEIKSDRDTLFRLFEQAHEYNAVFDRVTLVVGQRHLHDAIHKIPEWWGITLAKIDVNERVVFRTIREAKDNENNQIALSIARLLWRAEALKILEDRNEADGVRSKPRGAIHERLAEVLKEDLGTLKGYVRNALLVSRGDWRSVVQPMSGGD